MPTCFLGEDGWKNSGIRAAMLAEVHIPVIVDYPTLVMRHERKPRKVVGDIRGVTPVARTAIGISSQLFPEKS
jgi:hypothetical protein